MKYYTLFEDDNLFKNVTDDLNTGESWAESGMIWNSKEKADLCMQMWKTYGRKLHIVEVSIL